VAAARLVRGRDLPALGRRPHPAARKRRFSELGQHLLLARKNYQTQKEQQGWLYPPCRRKNRDRPRRTRHPSPRARAGAPAANGPPAGAPPPVLPPEWRSFVGRWFESVGCQVEDAARAIGRSSWSPWLQRKWRRQRVRLVFDPRRATLPKGAW